MDYQKLGFKAGIEIHQQLEGLKLFCNCPALNSDKESDLSCERRLRAVVGETGDVDPAAVHEMMKGKKFLYVSNSEDTCSVEYDEEPPRDVNLHHVHTAIMICKLLNAELVDEIQIMRKTVIDGSNVSGFQRTMLVGRNGWIDTSKGKVGIPSIFLEEEAAQKLEEDNEKVVYKLDRLGIALLEISTDASLKDPEHVKEAASIIGMILRSTERVKRGIGTIRQDVNVSIANGERIEIKGFQELKSIPKVIENEIKRQLELIEKGEKVKKEVRKANEDLSTSFLRPMPGSARLYPETDVLPVRITEDMLKMVKKPELITEKTAKLEKDYNISDVQAREIISENKEKDFKEFVKKYSSINASEIAFAMIDAVKDIKSRLKIDVSKLEKKDFEEMFEKINSGKITKSKEAVTEILCLKSEGKNVDYSKYKKADLSSVEKEIEEIVLNNPNLSIGAYMGLIMAKLKGKADGKELMEILKKKIS